ncbi:unnamed protein product, partial [Leptidea sinapis]
PDIIPAKIGIVKRKTETDYSFKSCDCVSSGGMHLGNRNNMDKSRKCILLTFIAIISILSYFTEVSALPTEGSSDSWPTFPRRNLAALAKNGYLKSLRGENYKRSISTLAKNGMLPTFTAPNEDADKQEEQDDQAQEKRNLASIARFRSYAAIKRNVQALARDGYRFGRGQYQSNDKRSLAKHSSDKNFGIGTLNDLPNDIPNSLSGSTSSRLTDLLNKHPWQQDNAAPKYYYFRSLKVPYHTSGKRYLILPAVDKVLLRKSYNNSLPSRRKNQ